MRILPLLLIGCASRYATDLEAQLEREVVALNQTVRRLQAESVSCTEALPPDRLYSELTQVFAGTEVEVTRTGRVTRLRVPAAHIFRRVGEPGLRDEADMTLDLLRMALEVNTEHTVRVVGHSDDRSLPTDGARVFTSHLDLSLFGAAAFAEALLAGTGIAPERIEVAGRGGWDPVASNDLPSGQDRNHRLEVFLTPPEG
jgi:flagellar motor protein MotB